MNLPYNTEEVNEFGHINFNLGGPNPNIPRRNKPSISPIDFNIDSKWKENRTYKVGKFHLNNEEEAKAYCSIMTAAVSGWFKIVSLERTICETANKESTNVIIDIEYYEREYIHKNQTS